MSGKRRTVPGHPAEARRCRPPRCGRTAPGARCRCRGTGRGRPAPGRRAASTRSCSTERVDGGAGGADAGEDDALGGRDLGRRCATSRAGEPEVLEGVQHARRVAGAVVDDVDHARPRVANASGRSAPFARCSTVRVRVRPAPTIAGLNPGLGCSDDSLMRPHRRARVVPRRRGAARPPPRARRLPAAASAPAPAAAADHAPRSGIGRRPRHGPVAAHRRRSSSRTTKRRTRARCRTGPPAPPCSSSPTCS